MRLRWQEKSCYIAPIASYMIWYKHKRTLTCLFHEALHKYKFSQQLCRKAHKQQNGENQFSSKNNLEIISILSYLYLNHHRHAKTIISLFIKTRLIIWVDNISFVSILTVPILFWHSIKIRKHISLSNWKVSCTSYACYLSSCLINNKGKLLIEVTFNSFILKSYAELKFVSVSRFFVTVVRTLFYVNFWHFHAYIK